MVSEVEWNKLLENDISIHESCNIFTDEFLKVTESCIPKKEVIIRSNDKIWFNSNLRKEIRKRDRFRKIFIKNKSMTNEKKFKNQRNRVNNLKKQIKQNFYDNINENLNELKQTNSRVYWKIINSLLKEDRSSNDIPPMQNPSNNYEFSYDAKKS
ncbi:Hypothetical predicted protein [Mytilus galloprovincialis]|uniref:Uncharacterized protein n=1 Tax=Mytilus galloprovincialis TaxID=29158 RepID=A0A8B6GX56_MYTGA|nr:Hypothetical predicted protein [Mytilus galloprovincialis]